MTPDDFDRFEKQRFDKIFDRLYAGDDRCLDNFFRSERVDSEAQEEKVVLPSFNENKIFSLLPFTKSLYVCICPACIDDTNFINFYELVSRGLIVPIFQAPFKAYADEIVAIASKYDSISRAEYQAFRYINMPTESRMNLCSNCAQRMFDTMKESIKSKRNRNAYLHSVIAIRDNAAPFLQFDRSLIEKAGNACASNRLTLLRQLTNLSFAVSQLKTSLAFNAPLMIDKADIELLPAELTAEIDQAKIDLSNLRSDTAQSFDLVFSSKLPIGAYAEIVKDFQPRICETVDLIVEKNCRGSREALHSEIMRLNAEIRTVRGSKRFNFMRATVDFVARGDDLLKAAIVGAAIAPLSSWFGCAGAAAVGSKKLREKLIKNSTATEQTAYVRDLKRYIKRDFQPYVDNLAKIYLQCSPSAIRLISIQDSISARIKADAA